MPGPKNGGIRCLVSHQDHARIMGGSWVSPSLPLARQHWAVQCSAGMVMGGSREDHGRIRGGSWEDHRRTMGGSWEDHGCVQASPWLAALGSVVQCSVVQAWSWEDHGRIM